MANPKKKKLSNIEIAFCESYLICLNKTKAAIDAGISEHTARQQGCQIHNRLHVRAYIEKVLSERVLSAAETTKLISDTAQANMGDYFKPVQVIKTPRIKVGLQYMIDRIQEEIDFEQEVADASSLTDEQNDTFFEQQQFRIAQKLRYEIELRRNPSATRIIDGERELVTEMQLDIDAVVADKEKGKIKSVKYTQFGIQVEMYSALDAADKIAKMHGLYEKDNIQQHDSAPIKVEIIRPDPVDE